ncbi:DUF4097 domain-containing protein [Bacteroidota bacterium]
MAAGLTGSYSTPVYSVAKLGISQKTSPFNYMPGEDIAKEFNVESGQTLHIDLETGGEIIIEGWDQNIVNVKAMISGRDADDVEMEFDQNSDGVEIFSDYRGRNRNRSCDIRLEIKVPKVFNLDLETSGGEIELDGIEGDIEGATMGGSLDLKNLKGKIDITTMGGSIDVYNCEANGKVKTMGGSIYLEDIIGDIDAETMGGSITQKNVKGNAGSKGKALDVSTMGGSIKIDDAPNGAYIKTMGGSIKVKSAGEFLEIETMGGGIDVDAIDGKIKAETMGGDIYVTMIGDPAKGERDVSLSSMGGDVELIVPDGLSMDIDIEITYTRRYEDDVDIISDFDIKIEKTDDWKYDHGDKRKKLYGTGQVGDGKNRIKIKTINGVVSIKKG